MRITPKWYGGKPNPKEHSKEQRLLRAYHKKLEELRLAGIGPGEFKPVEGPYADVYNREVEIIKGRVRQGDIVLDVGAGHGRIVEAALERGAGQVTALEPDTRAIRLLSEKFKTPKVKIRYGVAEKMDRIHDRSIDLVTFVGNSLGMMWKAVGDWEELVCKQREAILEMMRVARREVSFIVYGKESLESSLKAYEPVRDNVVAIRNGLMLVEGKDDKPFVIMDGGKAIERFVYQKFDRGYLENLLADAGLSGADYRITGVPDGKEYGYLVVIRP